MTKIAYLSAFYPYRGGIAQFNASLFRAFEALGHEAHAFTFSRQYPNILFPGTSQFVAPQDQADPIPAKRVLDSINPISYYTAAKAMGKPDILVMKYWMPFFAPSMGTVARQLRRRGTKIVSVLGNVKPHEPRMGDKALNQYFANSCDAFVAMSSAVRADLLELRPDAQVLYHPHPLYGHFGQALPKALARERLGLPQGKKVLLFFGLIRHYKGLDILLEAFKQLPADYALLIAGECYEDYADYRKILQGHEAVGRVFEHVRYIPDGEVPDFFSAADACVLPYRTATQSGVLAASLHFDCPVVVTDVGGLKEAVEPFGAGIAVPAVRDLHAQAHSIANAVRQLFAGDAQAMLQSNIHRFKEEYSWKGLAEKILAMVG